MVSAAIGALPLNVEGKATTGKSAKGFGEALRGAMAAPEPASKAGPEKSRTEAKGAVPYLAVAAQAIEQLPTAAGLRGNLPSPSVAAGSGADVHGSSQGGAAQIASARAIPSAPEAKAPIEAQSASAKAIPSAPDAKAPIEAQIASTKVTLPSSDPKAAVEGQNLRLAEAGAKVSAEAPVAGSRAAQATPLRETTVAVVASSVAKASSVVAAGTPVSTGLPPVEPKAALPTGAVRSQMPTRPPLAASQPASLAPTVGPETATSGVATAARAQAAAHGTASPAPFAGTHPLSQRTRSEAGVLPGGGESGRAMAFSGAQVGSASGAETGFSGAAPVDSASVAAQVAAVAQRTAAAMESGAASVRLQLDPPELGHVQVTLRAAQNGIVAVLRAENPATVAVLQGGEEDLRQRLGALGFKASSVEVTAAERPRIVVASGRSSAGRRSG